MNEGRCDERLKPRVVESTCLTYTGLLDNIYTPRTHLGCSSVPAQPLFFSNNLNKLGGSGVQRVENEKYEIKCDRLWILLRIYDVSAHIAEKQPSCPNAHITRMHAHTNTHAHTCISRQAKQLFHLLLG
jgi:hypothetical protein